MEMNVKDYSFGEMVEMLLSNPKLKFEDKTLDQESHLCNIDGSIWWCKNENPTVLLGMSKANLNARYTLVEKPLPQLSEEAKTVLRLVDPKYKWIANDDDGNGFICLYEQKPSCSNGLWEEYDGDASALNSMQHLFINFPTEKPYLIADLIGEGDGKVKSRLDVLYANYFNQNWDGRCPYDANAKWDELDESTTLFDGQIVVGCRGITCAECWNKPVEE